MGYLTWNFCGPVCPEKKPKTNVKYHLSQSESDWLMLLLHICPVLQIPWRPQGDVKRPPAPSLRKSTVPLCPLNLKLISFQSESDWIEIQLKIWRRHGPGSGGKQCQNVSGGGASEHKLPTGALRACGGLHEQQHPAPVHSRLHLCRCVAQLSLSFLLPMDDDGQSKLQQLWFGLLRASSDSFGLFRTGPQALRS